MSKLESRAPSSASSRTAGALHAHWAVGVALGIVVAACSSEGDPDPGTGGSGGAPGSGGKSVSTGGASAGGGSGGAATAGTSPTGAGGSAGTASPTAGTGTGGKGAGGIGGGSGGSAGTAPTGGTGGAAPTAGSAGTAPTGGTGGAATGGAGPEGGKGGKGMGGAGAGGASGGTGGGASGTGGAAGTGSGTCEKGTTMGNELLFIGESFVQASTIPEETTKLARAAGMLTANDSYVDKSVSGTWIGNGASNSIPAQYRSNSSGVRFVVMNGGGNDCWQGGMETHRTAALNAAEELFGDMAENGVEKVVYHFYPDPIGSMYNSLKACLDLLRPDMKALCDAQTAPKCYWLDLRETWEGHPEYTQDGIHVAGPGNVPTATAIFETMTANCVAP